MPASRPDEGQLVQTESGSQWGFLKNIVNIDRFFDSGVRAWEEMKNNRLQWWTDTYLSTITV